MLDLVRRKRPRKVTTAIFRRTRIESRFAIMKTNLSTADAVEFRRMRNSVTSRFDRIDGTVYRRSPQFTNKPSFTEETEIQDEEGPKPVAPPSVALLTSAIGTTKVSKGRMGDISGATEAILQFQLRFRVIRNKVPKSGVFLNLWKHSFLATLSLFSLLWEGNSKFAPVTPFTLSQLTFQHLHWAYNIAWLGCWGGCYRFWTLLILYYCSLCITSRINLTARKFCANFARYGVEHDMNRLSFVKLT